MRHSRDCQTIVLLVILTAALALRLRGIDFGLPDLLHPDEPFEVHRALRLGAGEFDFRRTAKGGLYLLLFLQMGLTAAFLLVTDRIPDLAAFGPWFVHHEEFFYLAGRVTSAVAGVATVFLLYRLGVRVKDRPTGLVAAALLALAPTHIAESHYATVDPLLVLLMTATWLFLLRAEASPRPRHLIGAGFFLAVSVATKLPAAVLFLPALAVVFRPRHPGWGARAAIAAAACLLTLAAVEPGYMVNGPRLAARMLRIGSSPEARQPATVAQAAADPAAAWAEENLYRFYAGSLRHNLGGPFLVCAAVGALFLLRRRPRLMLLFALFLVPYFLAIIGTPTRMHFHRYILPMLPPLGVLAGLGISGVAERVSGRRETTARCVAAGLSALLLVPQAPQAWASAQRFTADHSRSLAKEWAEAHLPPGSTVLMEGSAEHRSHYLVPLTPVPEDLTATIREVDLRDPGKARYLQMYLDRVRRHGGPSYRLRFVRQEEVWPDLAAARGRGLQYVAIQRGKFAATGLASGSPLLASRARFRADLERSGDPRPLASFGCSPEGEGLGPCIDLYPVGGRDAGTAPAAP